MRLGVHHYVSRLLDYFESADHFYMVLELHRGGSLLQYLADRNYYLPESRARVLAEQLA